MAGSWEVIAARKQQEQLDRIPKAWRLGSVHLQTTDDSLIDLPRRCGLLSNAELDLTEKYDATWLIQELRHGRLKSETVTTAFCKRAAIATQLTSCLTEIFFQDGIARAKELDAYLLKHGKPIGPLHGLPISLKDSFNVKGYDSSLGVAALCFQPAAKNSPLVDLLLSLGAVLYCKTNVPQTLSSLDSHNNIFGRVLNPLNRRLTAGGSSGGEGALLAIRGSPLGVGTDVGGSIRVPAMCNGLYGVKPSHGRVPYSGQQSSAPDGVARLTIEATAGPIARTMRDCTMFLKVIADSRPELVDCDVFSQAWALQPCLDAHRPLRVGVVYWDGHTKPLPAVHRLMTDVAGRLRSSGRAIEVVEVEAATLLAKCVKIFNALISVDGANAWFDILEKHNEPLSPWLANRLRRRPGKDTKAVAALQVQKHALQTEALKLWQRGGGYWQSNSAIDKLDVLICPPAPHPVAPIDGWNTINYTGAWNLLDYPAGIMPVRAVTAHDLSENVAGEPLNGWDKINRELWSRTNRNLYLGSPLSIQVVSPRLEERKLVEAMAVIAEAIKTEAKPSRL